MKIDIHEVDMGSIQIDGIESWDAPDYCDAYIIGAQYNNGTPLSEDELVALQEIVDMTPLVSEYLH